MATIERRSTITCPRCLHRATLTMPLNVCRIHYQCPGCGTVLRGNAYTGCVFCNWGSVPCPFMQNELAIVDILDERRRQRDHLLAMDPEQWMRRDELHGHGGNTEANAADKQTNDNAF